MSPYQGNLSTLFIFDISSLLVIYMMNVTQDLKRQVMQMTERRNHYKEWADDYYLEVRYLNAALHLSEEQLHEAKEWEAD